MSGRALAQETRVGGMEDVLGGYTEFGAQAGTRNTVGNGNFGGDRKYTFFMDNEVHFEANGATDRGLLYGSKVWVDFGSSGLGGSGINTTVDEAALYFSATSAGSSSVWKTAPRT
jgi:hypothetical protein